ncbi:MAG: hypothetical protein JO166_10260 [Deltaproteobacteria bacterium]|nr:hypothetical protein [Deltaproteobacteria bacterium]
MDTAEIVERKPERNSGPMVLPFLGEGIRQPQKTANAHTKAEITSFDN